MRMLQGIAGLTEYLYGAIYADLAFVFDYVR
jgi:hypothetical protein